MSQWYTAAAVTRPSLVPVIHFQNTTFSANCTLFSLALVSCSAAMRRPSSLVASSARVRSIVRRRESSEAPARQIAEFSGWRFNLANNRLTSPDDVEHALSTAESELLKVFINNPNRILQREKLMGTRDLAPTDRAIDVRVSRLRRKLEPDAHSPAFIKTVYGAGYLFLATVTWSGDNA